MQHLQVKAAATATDEGVFSALAAAYSVDRVQDQIVPGAFEKTIKAWQATGRRLPVHWDHEGAPDKLIGSVDPAQMRETQDGLYVEGKLDLKDSEVAREAWRSMKNNAVALSFGYLTLKSRKEGGINKLLELDLFEISIVPAPANNDTKVLSLKSALAVEQDPTIDTTSPDPAELRRKTFDAAVEAAEGYRKPAKDEDEPVVSDEEMARAKSVLLYLRDNPDLEPDAVAVFSKTVWTKTYIDALPDEHFLFVDAEKVRHFAYKDAEGAVDLPHLRNALAGISKSKRLSRSRRETLQREAHQLLEEATKALGPPVEPEETKPQDALRSRTFGVALEIANDGVKVEKRVEPEPEPEPLDPAELRRRSFELALDVATG